MYMKKILDIKVRIFTITRCNLINSTTLDYHYNYKLTQNGDVPLLHNFSLNII